MNPTTGIFPTAVIDVAMPPEGLGDVGVGMMLVAHQMRRGADQGVYDRLENGDAVIFHRNGPNRSATRNRDQHSLLVRAPAAFVRPAILAARLAAKIFFVQLDDAA